MQVERGYFHTPNERFFDVTSFVAAYDFVARPNVTPDWERFDFAQMILVLSGQGVYTTEQGAYPFSAGSLIYRPAFCESKYEWTGGKVRFALIDFVCQSPAMQIFARPPFALQEEEKATLFDLMKTAARICEPVKDESTDGMRVRDDIPTVVMSFVLSSLERFLSMLYCRLAAVPLVADEAQKVNAHLGQSRLVEEVRRYLLSHITERLTISDICAQFWVSATTLSHKFRKETGKGIMDYFTDLKIDEAKIRIRKSAGSFSEIAEALGFSSLNYFSKMFKRRTGMTPTAYSKFVSKRRAATAE
ncbi:MAG: helix-turn-helix transcriptional regulator [Clostridia bacterium]|nr:helix-turn-helix transcriptional regulator [Clostridia bacterium]